MISSSKSKLSSNCSKDNEKGQQSLNTNEFREDIKKVVNKMITMKEIIR